MEKLKLTERYYFTNTIELQRHSSICMESMDKFNVTLCCDFNIEYTELNIPASQEAYTYRLAAFFGTRVYSVDRNCGELHCAVVACLNNDQQTCGRRFQHSDNLVNRVVFEKIDIKTSVYTEDKLTILMMPNSVDTSIVPLDASQFEFETNTTE